MGEIRISGGKRHFQRAGSLRRVLTSRCAQYGRFLVFATVVACCAARAQSVARGGADQQALTAQQKFVIALPPDIASERVQIQYFLRGGFGHYAAAVAPAGARQVEQVEIDTTVKGQPATSLKAVIFVPGCAFVTVDAPDLSRSRRMQAFACKPLATVPIRGRVLPSEATRDRDYVVEVNLVANWVMDFFGIQSGAVPLFQLAHARPNADGAFEADLPDLMHDPAARGYDVNAYFDFIARESGEGNRALGSLQPVDAAGSPYALMPQTSYPDEVSFRTTGR